MWSIWHKTLQKKSLEGRTADDNVSRRDAIYWQNDDTDWQEIPTPKRRCHKYDHYIHFLSTKINVFIFWQSRLFRFFSKGFAAQSRGNRHAHVNKWFWFLYFIIWWNKNAPPSLLSSWRTACAFVFIITPPTTNFSCFSPYLYDNT